MWARPTEAADRRIMQSYRQQWLARCVLGMVYLTSVPGWALAADFRPLLGRWQRADGGYVIDIRRVNADGTMDAGYFNPRPINVSGATAGMLKGYIKVEIELRDSGYPGSTYTLLYDPEKEILVGLYFQAQQRQTYDVVFNRMATP
jgi:hypothetical protein